MIETSMDYCRFVLRLNPVLSRIVRFTKIYELGLLEVKPTSENYLCKEISVWQKYYHAKNNFSLIITNYYLLPKRDVIMKKLRKIK